MPVPQAEVERRIGALQREVAHMQAMQDAQADITNRMAKRQALSPHQLLRSGTMKWCSMSITNMCFESCMRGMTISKLHVHHGSSGPFLLSNRVRTN